MKEIEGYGGLYKVDEEGNIYGHRNKILKPHVVNSYNRVTLCLSKKRKSVLVHRVVAQAFLNNRNGFRCVNHLNLNRTDNRAINLEWCTHKRNAEHAIMNGKKYGRRGCGINDKTVNDIKQLLNSEIRIIEISKKLDVSYQTVSNIKYGTSHK